MDVEETAKIILEAIRKLPKEYEDNLKKLDRIEREITDINHYMELVDLNASEGFQAYKDKQRALRERRKLKDDNDELRVLYPFLKSLRDRQSVVEKAVQEVRKVKNVRKHRSYRCRVRKDLEPIINQVKL